MKRNLAFLIQMPICLLTLVVALSIGWGFCQAQGRGPVVDILGRPKIIPPDAHTYVSVVDPNTGRAIDELSDANFTVQVSAQHVDATVSLETRGIAVAMVIDRGGIAERGDPRIGQAVDLADGLLGILNTDGSVNADMAALIGIRGREQGGLTPLVEFTDYDPNVVRNQFDKLRTEIVDEVTPLYDGIDQAIEWIAENDDTDIQEKLAHRRPIIVIFSDGIDNQFSSESHETIIINKCLQNGISLYAVRMEAPGRTTDADNLEALASQTNGIYATHNEETHEQVLSLFEDVVTQRQAYRVTFSVYRPRGDYQVRIQVLDTPVGDGSDETTVSSQLQLPEIALTAPTGRESYTVAYSDTLERFELVAVTLRTQITPVDGAARDPEKVRYFANGVLIGTGTAPPNFELVWDVSTIVTATEESQTQEFTLIAEADDSYLGGKMTSQPVNINVNWEAMPPPPLLERVEEEVRTNWWIIVILVGLLFGLVVLLFLLRRMQTRLESTAIGRAATGILRRTRLLGPMPPAHGKLVITQGANMGREFRLAAPLVKVGRDPQFSDFALHDEFVSNPHFSIQLDQTQFHITDEGSTNGTRVNGMPIPPYQRVLLQPDAIIEVGQTRLQFRRLGGTTRQLDRGSRASPPPGVSPAGPPPTPDQAQSSYAPPQPSQPSDSVQGPPGSDPYQRGGPTRQA